VTLHWRIHSLTATHRDDVVEVLFDCVCVCVFVQHVHLIRSDVSVMDCVFLHVSCVTATHSVMTTATNTTALTITVSTQYALMGKILWLKYL